MKTKYCKFKNGLIMLICCLYLVGCSASKHLGVATIKKPDITSKDTEAWRMYYNDQFDAYAGVVTPPDASFSEEAQTGYKLASIDYRKQVGTAHMNTYLIAGGISVFLFLILPYMLVAGAGN